MEFNHMPVLLEECIEGLNIRGKGIYLDATLGGGNHSEKILQKLDMNGLLVGIDKDGEAIQAADKKLKGLGKRYITVNDDFKNSISILDKLNIKNLDGVLIDLGISSYQIDCAERGFSYMKDSHLDMRMDKSQDFSAYDIVNGYSYEALSKVLWEYGEEKLSRRIADKIIKERAKKPIETTLELASLVEKCYPPNLRYKFGHPAKRTFQAIRIEVNNELEGLFEIIKSLTMRLNKGGRICVISFHSLEDRIAKRCFEFLHKECICEPTAPICTCNKKREIVLINKKPIIASKEELELNKRAESAKLRIAEKL